jgi:hypothetical protein
MFKHNPFNVGKPTIVDRHGNTRLITPSELREEWRRIAYLSYGAQVAASNDITAKTENFMAGPIHDRYELDVYKKYDSIVKLTTDEDVKKCTKEKRPCHNGDSKLHELSCGHLAYSEIRSLRCGPSCKIPYVGKKTMLCILCMRREQDKTKMGTTGRWHDMLIPRFGHPHCEEKWILQRLNSFCQVEAAYLDPHGYILLPRIHCVIAMVRAYELRQEAETKEGIRRAIKPICTSPDAADVAIEYFEYFLVFHLCFWHADMRILAVIAIHLSLLQRVQPPIRDAILETLGIEEPPEFDEMFDMARTRLYLWAGTHMSWEVTKDEPWHVRNNPAMVLAKEMANRIWILFCGSDPIFGAGRWVERRRTMAFCLEYAFQRYGCGWDYNEILRRLGGERFAIDDLVIQNTMKRFVQGAIADGINWAKHDVMTTIVKRDESN